MAKVMMTANSEVGNIPVSEEKQKPVTVRWPLAFFKSVKMVAVERDETMQALITDAVCAYLGLPGPDPVPDDEDDGLKPAA